MQVKMVCAGSVLYFSDKAFDAMSERELLAVLNNNESVATCKN